MTAEREPVSPGVTAALFDGVEILELLSADAAAPCRRAAATAGRLAAQMGATVWSDGAPGLGPDRSFMLGKARAGADTLAAPVAWSTAAPGRVLLAADVPGGASDLIGAEGLNAVVVTAAPWHNEATLFAASGLADLFGDPAGAPLIPSGEWAAVTVAYAVLGALASAQAFAQQGEAEIAHVECVEALRWVNWKAPAMAWAGTPVTREGRAAQWPVLRCADGFAAFVFTPRDWKRLVEMVGDERLSDERFKRHDGRSQLRQEYLGVLGEWASAKTKADLDRLFHAYAIPGAAVATPADLLTDPTLVHRAVFDTVDLDGASVPVAVAPVRVHAVAAPPAATEPLAETDAQSGLRLAASPVTGEPLLAAGEHSDLPLAGVRVLDLGVLTAGAGTSSLLADLGAEVIKIESIARPDMFRFWTGNDDSPLFHFSNRSKKGVDLNLKTADERAAFLDLVAGADAVIENFRRGVLERLDLGFDVLREANPRIVLGSVSGQGASGPRADHTTFGSTLEAASGFSALTTGADGVPAISGPNLNFPDQTVCLFAGAVLAAAITKSRAAGTAFHLDISQRDVAVYACGPVIEQAARGLDPHRWAARRGSDGRWVTVGADGVTEAEVLDGAAVLEACLRDSSSAVVRAPTGELVKGFPFTFERRTMTIGGPAPGIGEHNDLILKKDS